MQGSGSQSRAHEASTIKIIQFIIGLLSGS